MGMYFKYVRQQLKISVQYRSATFIMMGVSLLTSAAGLFGTYMLFLKFDNIGGYSFNDVLLTYSIVLMVFSISELLFRGFDQFDMLIMNGDLDKFMIKPRSIFLQVLGSKIEMGKLGRVILSVGVLIFAVMRSSIEWNFLKIITLILMVISGCIIFLSVFLLSSSVNIFTIKGNEFINIFTNGGRELCSYPLDIYAKELKNFFTFIIPYGCFNYLPLHFLLDMPKATILGNMLSPVYGMLFFIPCLLIFNWSLTKYTSSGT